MSWRAGVLATVAAVAMVILWYAGFLLVCHAVGVEDAKASFAANVAAPMVFLWFLESARGKR